MPIDYSKWKNIEVLFMKSNGKISLFFVHVLNEYAGWRYWLFQTFTNKISDDEDDTHPNIDTPSLFRWRHQARLVLNIYRINLYLYSDFETLDGCFRNVKPKTNEKRVNSRRKNKSESYLVFFFIIKFTFLN